MRRFQYLFNEGGEGEGGGGGAPAGTGTLLGAPGSGGNPGQGAAPAATATVPAATSGAAFDIRQLIGDDGNFVEGWTQKLPEDMKEHIAHYGKYKSPVHALQHTRDLQGVLGSKSEAVLIPGPDSPKDVVDKFRERLGVPATPEGYKLEKPSDLPEGVTWNDARVKDFSSLAHEIGLTPQQVMKLQQWDVKQLAASNADVQARVLATEKEELAKQEAILQKAWGTTAEVTRNTALATRAALTGGFSMEQITSDPIFRNAEVVKAFAKLGGLMSEDVLAKGADAGGFDGAYSQAMDIINNPNNALHKRYWNGDQAIRDQVLNGLSKKR